MLQHDVQCNSGDGTAKHLDLIGALSWRNLHIQINMLNEMSVLIKLNLKSSEIVILIFNLLHRARAFVARA